MRPPDPPPLLPEVPGVAFRPVPGCPGVAAGSDGSVWRLDPLLALEPYPRPSKWRPAQVYARADGPAVVLPEGGRFVYRRVEDVVAAAFGRAAGRFPPTTTRPRRMTGHSPSSKIPAGAR